MDITSRHFAFGLGTILFLSLTLSCKQGYSFEPNSDRVKEGMQATMAPVYNFTMDDIDGQPVNLQRFQGKVLLLVNTASLCGNTPQYEGLQTLYEEYQEQGLEILAFPANNFGKQEPGTNEEIKSFCYTKYALKFSLFTKISVKGDDTHPLYQYLTTDSPFPGEITWNFQKFLVDRQGHVIARYRPGLKPLSQQIVTGIEEALSRS